MRIPRDRIKGCRHILLGLSKDDHIWLDLLDFEERRIICAAADILERVMGNGSE